MARGEALESRIGVAADPAQYLVFSLGDDEFAVEILRVQEIRGAAPITALPNAPVYVTGVMNLRGSIIPVVDLRARLGSVSGGRTSSGVIIVVTVGSQVKGMAVDAVSDVVSIPAAEIQPPPELDAVPGPRCVRGLTAVADKLVILLDLDQVLGTDDGDARPAGAR